jgi:Ca2+-binding RTX toxin-like protein
MRKWQVLALVAFAAGAAAIGGTGSASGDVSPAPICVDRNDNQWPYRFDATSSRYVIDGTKGDDFIDCHDTFGLNLLIAAGGGNDVVFGSNPDPVQGGGGNDTINGGNGDDSLDGSLGNDELNGNAGVDSLSGWYGDDTLNGGPGGDGFLAGAGIDACYGGPGTDIDTSIYITNPDDPGATPCETWVPGPQ